MKEEAILQALASGEDRERAFTELVKTYSERVYWCVRHIVGGHSDADDIVQNTFVKVWTRLDDFRGDSQFSTWLYRIAVNEALDHVRREKRRKDANGDIESGEAARCSSTLMDDTYFDADEAERLLREAVDRLPEAQRAVFVLKYFENMQYKDISQILNTSVGGLKANYHYAVEKIEHYVKGNYQVGK